MMKSIGFALLAVLGLLAPLALPAGALASELDLEIPAITTSYSLFGAQISGLSLLYGGLVVCVLGGLFGLSMFNQVRRMPAHKSMLEVSNIIWETCKTYVIQQGRLLVILELF